MALGMEVSLGLGHIMLDGEPTLLPQKGGGDPDPLPKKGAEPLPP